MGINKVRTSEGGFSFIEMLVVLFVIGVSLPALFNLFYVDIANQKKVLILREVKENGDSALTHIETLVKNRGYKVVDGVTNPSEICDIPGSVVIGGELYMQDYDGNYFSIQLDTSDTDSYKIASSSYQLASPTPVPYILTSSYVHIDNLSFHCERTSEYSPPVISFSFDVSQSGGSRGRFEEENELSYGASIKLLNYESE